MVRGLVAEPSSVTSLPAIGHRMPVKPQRLPVIGHLVPVKPHRPARYRALLTVIGHEPARQTTETARYRAFGARHRALLTVKPQKMTASGHLVPVKPHRPAR